MSTPHAGGEPAAPLLLGRTDDLATGDAALAEGRWADARDAFAAAPESPEALDGLGHALHHLGEYAAAIPVRERAFAAFRARGETRYPAVLAARWIAFDHAAVLGEDSVANGWLERAHRLLTESGDCVEKGWVALARALVAADLDETDRLVAEAADRARRFGDTDLGFLALAHAGALHVRRGRVREGMRCLDEAVAAAQSGEVADPSVAGEVFCKMLLACEAALDVRRAQQWIAVATAFERRNGTRWISAICRMHHGGLLVAAGRWAEAEAELARSVRDYHASFEPLCAGAVARLADLRVRQGRLDDADRLLEGHEGDAYAVRPLVGASLLRGQADVAAGLLRRHLGAGPDEVAAAPLLEQLVRAEWACGRVEDASAAGARLDTLAASASVTACADLAHSVLAGEDDAAASRHLESAVTGFDTACLPYEAAGVRLELAQRLAAGSAGLADAEARRALAAFTRLGAVAAAETAAGVLRRLERRASEGPGQVSALSPREREVLDLLALGLSNPEIAARLVISRKTAAHHVSAVLAKLGVRNRAEAAAHAAGLRARSGRAVDTG